MRSASVLIKHFSEKTNEGVPSNVRYFVKRIKSGKISEKAAVG